MDKNIIIDKENCNHQGYQLKIQLEGLKNPPVWRRVQVHGSMPMHLLHMVIQAVMGWQDYHLYMFNNGEGYDYGDVLIKIPDEYDEDNPSPIDSRGISVGEAFCLTQNLRYIYDFGDDWVHRITIEKVIPQEDFKGERCIAGRGTCPPEDVGGIGGYELMKEALTDKKHPEHKSFRQWLGLKRGEQFNPDEFFVGDANFDLREYGFHTR